MIKKTKTPYLRDVYLAYLIVNARRTRTDEYPIIEKWMVANEPPRDIIQWDRRSDVDNPADTAISFYCNDLGFQPILNNPKNYVEKLKKYYSIVGLDASPYDNMPVVVQKSQIFLNLACTYFYGSSGIKVIPNVRIGDNRTFSSLEAYPKHCLIAIGTHGFIKLKENRKLFTNQINRVVNELEPSGICVYGPMLDMFEQAKSKGVGIYQYDSYTMKENAKDKMRQLFGGNIHER